MIKLTIFLIFSSQLCFASNPTTFRWLVTSENPPKGRCMEVDKETLGDIFQKRAPNEKCRPKEEGMTTLWLQDPEGPGGRCYQVDKETMGKGYSRAVGQKECEPGESSTHLIEGKCYLKGETGKGSVYLVSTLKERCKPSETTYKFIPSSNGLSGRCVSLDLANGTTFNESLKKCRPEKTHYTSLDLDGESTCFEVATDLGPAGYIKKVNSKFCRPTETELVWVQLEENSGACYLKAQFGSDYKEKIAPKKCFDLYNVETQFFVLSPIRGQCFVVDKKEKGGQLRQFVPTDQCLSGDLETRLVSYEDRPYCIVIDKDDLMRGFRKIVGLKKCFDSLEDYVWVLSDRDPLKGVCYEKVSLGGELQYRGVQKSKCRPKEVLNKWVVSSKEEVLLAKCYEVDKEKGPEGFIQKVPRKNCRPKGDLVVKYFHPKEYKKGGCYLVDKETLGGRYSVRTDDKKCKAMLFPEK